MITTRISTVITFPTKSDFVDDLALGLTLSIYPLFGGELTVKMDRFL